MSRTARSAAVVKLLCDRFPKTFSRHDPRPLKVGVHAELLVVLAGTIEPRDLQSAIRAYTSNARYLGALTAGACRVDLDGKAAGTVTHEDEAVAKKRLVESTKCAAPQPKLAPAEQTGPKPSAAPPTGEDRKPPALCAPKRLSLADLREAGRRRREAAA